MRELSEFIGQLISREGIIDNRQGTNICVSRKDVGEFQWTFV